MVACAAHVPSTAGKMMQIKEKVKAWLSYVLQQRVS